MKKNKSSTLHTCLWSLYPLCKKLLPVFLSGFMRTLNKNRFVLSLKWYFWFPGSIFLLIREISVRLLTRTVTPQILTLCDTNSNLKDNLVCGEWGDFKILCFISAALLVFELIFPPRFFQNICIFCVSSWCHSSVCFRRADRDRLRCVFQITGQEEAMYQARVTETVKGRKNDLPVKNGDIISIIRTTKCPKGKWLARDSSNNCESKALMGSRKGWVQEACFLSGAAVFCASDGYVAVGHVELDIKEMMELGKKTTRRSSSNVMEIDGFGAGGMYVIPAGGKSCSMSAV